MPKRVAIELDGVLVHAPPDPAMDGHSENFWETLGETEPNVVARLAGMAAERRWEVIFLANRPPSGGATVQVQSQRWLEAKGFALPCVFVAPGPRGRIASALHLDLVIDVTPKNCVNVVSESAARTILVWRGDRSTLPPDARRPEIDVARSFGECLDMLATVDDPSPRNAGVVTWLRRLFGWKEAKA
jgi:hypothetical protein